MQAKKVGKVVPVAILVVVAIFTMMFASSASAYCGPAFSNKAQAVNYYKTNPAAAHALRGWLLKHKAYEYSADQDLITYLEQSNVKVFNAPQGYKLKKNTSCPNGPGEFRKYGGLLENMSGKPMLWYCNKAGKCYPVLKGYCRNAVFGPPVMKKPPKKAPPKKCKCKKKKKKHKKPPPKATCEAKGLVDVGGGVCVSQTQHVEQDCKATVNGQWIGGQCVVIQNNCGNVVVGNGGTVDQGDNCVVEQPPPCTTNCHPEEPPPVDHAPQISCVYPPHIYEGGSQYMWCEASDSDGDTLTVNIKGDSHLTVSSTIPVNERWDGSSCPSGVNCYRATLWGKTAGTGHIVAEVTANGKTAKSDGYVEVVKDEF